jgi:hypothetical protein
VQSSLTINLTSNHPWKEVLRVNKVLEGLAISVRLPMLKERVEYGQSLFLQKARVARVAFLEMRLSSKLSAAQIWDKPGEDIVELCALHHDKYHSLYSFLLNLTQNIGVSILKVSDQLQMHFES